MHPLGEGTQHMGYSLGPGNVERLRSGLLRLHTLCGPSTGGSGAIFSGLSGPVAPTPVSLCLRARLLFPSLPLMLLEVAYIVAAWRVKAGKQ